ncbi:MAG: hypothetical protein PHY29_04670 [Syntrophales bacterium]|nr:hypothetical protein [Syntrophales bacterium]
MSLSAAVYRPRKPQLSDYCRHVETVVPEKASIPGAVIAMQSFDDFLGFNPHCHIIGTLLRQ